MNAILTEYIYEHDADYNNPRRVWGFSRYDIDIYMYAYSNDSYGVEVVYKKYYVNVALFTKPQHDILKFIDLLFNVLFSQYNIKNVIVDDTIFNKIIKRCEDDIM